MSVLPRDLSASDLGILRIDHVGIAVPSMDEALDLWCGTLGMRCLHREDNYDEGVSEAMLLPGAVQEDQGVIQLLAPIGPTSTIARFLASTGPGIQQLAVTVVDIDHACAVLRDKGIRLLYTDARRGTAGSRANFIHPRDTGGVLLELVEPAPQREEQ